MTRRERWRLAWAVFRGAEIVEHLTPRDYVDLCHERRMQSDEDPSGYWFVVPDPTVWVPRRFPAGKNDTRLSIAPVSVRRRVVPADPQSAVVDCRVTVVRW